MLVALAAAHAILPPQHAAAPVLARGVPVERTIASSERHEYRLDIPAGAAARIAIEQRGIDVVVQLVRDDGTPIVDFQDERRVRSVETFVIVAERAPAVLVVKPARQSAARGAYVLRVEDVRPASDEDRARQEAGRLRLIARDLSDADQDKGAAAKLEEAVSLLDRAGGSSDVRAPFGMLLLALGDCYLDLRDTAKAEPVLVRARDVLEQAVGADHPNTALAAARLAVVYERTDQRAKAERLLQDALAATERALGPDHMQVATVLVTFGALRYSAGDLEAAAEAEQRAMRIAEKNDSTDTIVYASLLNNLGQVYLQKHDYSRAGELFERALAIGQRHAGVDSYWAGITLQNLGVVARQQKDYGRARAYYERALAIRLKVVGPEHEDLASLLNNIALVERDGGNIEKSIETHLRALEIWEKTTGPYSSGTVMSLGNLARTYASMGDAAGALRYQRQVDRAIEKQLTLNLAIGSERQKLAFAEAVSGRTARTISLHLNLAPANADAAALAALVVLQRKGRVLDAMTDTIGSLRQRVAGAADRNLLDERGATIARLARVVLDGRQSSAPDEYLRTIKSLEQKKESLEAAISEHSAEFRANSRPVTLEAVQQAIPSDAALVEFAVFRPFDPKASRNVDAYGPAHYAAYVIQAAGAPRGVDLGDAKRVDALVADFREALRDPARSDVRARGRAVAAAILDPIQPLFGTASRLLVSPDGQLDLIPFEALVDPRGRFLVSRYSMTYLTSGRDLLRMQVPRPAGAQPLLVADPAFGGVSEGPDPDSEYFARLPGTALEARAIGTLFPDARLLLGAEASKAAIEQAHAPRMLHIASHGFFLDDPRTRGNPLLRSGIALAAANRAKGSNESGILTALEASNLDLWGTKLVTLSACDTGIGIVRNGEGVYGLRRAFVLAGAEALVMSLWPVSDYVTRQMMTAFYRGLKDGLGRAESLRQAQLTMLKRPGRQHPFYWAAFIQSGDWRPLGRAPRAR